MLKLSQPITSINGFKIGDRVRLKDGDGRPHIIKSFSIDGTKEFFFEVQFEDGTDTMLDNIALLPSNLDEAAEEASQSAYSEPTAADFAKRSFFKRGFKAGAEWMAGQGQTIESLVWRDEDDKLFIEAFVDENKFKMADNIIIQIRKKQ